MRTQSTEPIEILGIAGSLRAESFNRALLRAAGELLPPAVRWRTYEELAQVPPYNEDEDTDPPPPAVAHLRRTIGRADALLIATPEYNHSIPGVLKNAVDWASRPYGDSVLIDLPVAVVGASPSRFGARWAQEDLRRVLDACQSEVLEAGLAVSRAAERFEEGELVDEEIRRALRTIVGELVGVASSVGAEDTSPVTEAAAACC